MRFKLKNIITIILFLAILLGYSFSNEFELYPASWTTFKYHCDQPLNIKIKKWDYNFTTFSSVIRFNPWNVLLTHNSINSFFNTFPTWYVLNNLYFAEWANMVSLWTSDMYVANFTLKTKEWFTWNSVLLKFTDRFGNDPDLSSPENTDDSITITSPDFVWDTLSWVTNATYYLEAYPCVEDTNAPIVFNNSWSPNINWWRILGSWNDIKLLLIDWIWINKHYWYQGLPVNINNYVPALNNVDNQNWVNSWTIKVKINNSANWWNIETPILNIYPYTGSEFPNRRTWNSLDRGYWVEFKNEIPFEIEKQVTITVSGYDNYNSLGNRFLMNRTFVFNISENPSINIINPINASDNQDYNLSGIYFYAKDSWAWIDTGNVFITIPSIYSGSELLLTGYTYSWSELEFYLISWSSEIGGASSYEIKLIPKRKLPSDTEIVVTWMVLDLVWNTGFGNWSFSTRPSCLDLWCFDILNINFLSGNSFISNPRLFSWEYLIVTWLAYNTNYPYFTWINSDILVCWFEYEWTVLTWNVNIYSDTWVLINWYFYTWNELYITGLNFVYNNWTITVID